MKKKIKNIKSMRELSLYKQNLEYKAKFHEKEVASVSEDIIDNFTLKLKDLTFNLAMRFFSELFTKREKK